MRTSESKGHWQVYASSAPFEPEVRKSNWRHGCANFGFRALGGGRIALMNREHPVCELGDRVQGRVRLIEMRGMPAFREQQRLDRAIGRLLGQVELCGRAVLVVGALYDEDWYPDMGKALLDAPALGSGIEPRVVPGAECGIDVVAVVAPQPLAQVALLESLPGGHDAADGKVL